jgi:hypothetical protein
MTSLTRIDRHFSRRPLVLCGLAVLLSSCGDYTLDPDCLQFFETDDLGRFSLRGEGSALHQDTGLLWYRCAGGMRFSNGQCMGEPLLLSWSETQQFITEFSQNSNINWRLPSNDEHRSITEAACRNPAVNTNVFPQLPVENFWTSDNGAIGTGMHCMVYTFQGQIACREQTEALHAFMLVSGPD